MATQLGSTTPRKSIYGLVNPLAIAIVFTIVAQQWSGLDTPDSEFYASLAIFTSDVTDRAPIDSYYWTRLGLIAPAHFLIGAFGIWEGFALYKAASRSSFRFLSSPLPVCSPACGWPPG